MHQAAAGGGVPTPPHFVPVCSDFGFGCNYSQLCSDPVWLLWSPLLWHCLDVNDTTTRPFVWVGAVSALWNGLGCCMKLHVHGQGSLVDESWVSITRSLLSFVMVRAATELYSGCSECYFTSFLPVGLFLHFTGSFINFLLIHSQASIQTRFMYTRLCSWNI